MSPTGAACPNCGRPGSEPFYRQSNVPVHCVLLFSSSAAARDFPRGDIELAFCSGCQFVFNQAFRPELEQYGEGYEETQGFSGVFQKFHQELAERLIRELELRGKRVVEIGCGKGEFLLLLSRLAQIEGLGIDPAYVPGRLPLEPDDRLHFLRELYDGSLPLDADLVCCKMTIEHIPNTLEFLQSISRGMEHRRGSRPHVYFQAPNGGRVLERAVFWDVYYEHCSYFTRDALAHLFAFCGFAVDTLRLEFQQQYLSLIGHPDPSARPAPPQTDWSSLVSTFSERCRTQIDSWRRRIDRAADRGPVVLWGGGSKAVAFLSHLGADVPVQGAVDINPHRQGTYLAGSGLEIYAPQRLREIDPALVVVMNSNYEAEIRNDLAGLGLQPELAVLAD